MSKLSKVALNPFQLEKLSKCHKHYTGSIAPHV